MPNKPPIIDLRTERAIRKQPPEGALPMLVVYLHPRDCPHAVVVRRWYCLPGVPDPVPDDAFHFNEPDALIRARTWIRQDFPHLSLVPRSPHDDPVIVEIYM